MSAHTKGPWELDTDGLFVTAEQQQMRVCDLRGFGYLTGRTTPELSDDEAYGIQERNGHLITAAPDLLDAARDARALLMLADSTLPGWDETVNVLAAAIALAEGRS